MSRRPQNPSPIQDTDLWDCVNSSFIVDKDVADQDVIGFERPCGITIYAPVAQDESIKTSDVQSEQSDYQMIVDNLDQASIKTWVEDNSIDHPTLDKRLRLKFLIVNQVVRGDTLRPPADAGACVLSRKSLQMHFGCPPVALEKVSRHDRWTWKFPSLQASDSSVISCTGLGIIDVNIIWMRKDNSSATWAIAAFSRPVLDARTKLEIELKRLYRYCELPSFLPFVALTGGAYDLERRMDVHRQSVFRTDVQLGRFPDGKVASQLYFSATTNAQSIAGEQRCAEVMTRTLKSCLDVSPSATRRTDARLVDKTAEFNTAISYLKQSMQATIEDCRESQAQITRQIECILGFMAQSQAAVSIKIAENQSKLAEASQREQTISVEIARSSQQIAAETRRDGSSMKTLAVVTLVYLPCTTVSSILAMPLFDWDAETGAVINPRIWVFCVFAIPLTVMTIVLWQLWLKMRGDRISKAEVDGGTIPGGKP